VWDWPLLTGKKQKGPVITYRAFGIHGFMLPANDRPASYHSSAELGQHGVSGHCFLPNQ
jgi:hypothetical protein